MYLSYLNPAPYKYWFEGVAAFELRAALSLVCFCANLQDIYVRLEAETAQLTPSTFTEIFEVSLENPVPLITKSWPFGDPEFVLTWVIPGKTVYSKKSFVREAFLVGQSLVAHPATTC